MKITHTIFLFAALLLGCLPATAQTTLLRSIQHDNLSRDYNLYLPSGYSSDANMPLVLNLHGLGSNDFEQQVYSQLFAVADTAGFLVCHPVGLERSWNVGWDFGSEADDVGFLSALIDSLVTEFSIDPSRVYACGMSNGGFMSYSLACELNDKVAAVASVTGALSPAYAPTCEPGRAVPVMQIHGTDDTVVRYNGTPGVSIPIEEVVDFWVSNNGCDTTPVLAPVPDIDPDDGCTAERFDYQDCANSSAVAFYKVDGGGHTWPGALVIFDITNQDFNASVEIWQFFKQYRLDDVVSIREEIPTSEWRLRSFPNPAGDLLYLESAAVLPGSLFELRNTTGQRVLSGRISDAGQPISLASLPAGFYVLHVRTSSGNWLSSKILHR